MDGSSHISISGAVGMGKPISTRWYHISNSCKHQSIANIIQTEYMRKLSKDQCQNAAARAEASGLVINSVLVRQFRN